MSEQPQDPEPAQHPPPEAPPPPHHTHYLLLQCQFWIYHLLVLALCLYLLFLFTALDSEIASIASTSQYKYAQEAIALWNKGYIVDIVEVDTNNCPEGYREVIEYPWHGTADGCYCQTWVNNHASEYILKVVLVIKQGMCNSELISLGCSSVPAVPAQNMKMWKGGKLLCYKRVQSLSFFNSTLERTPSGSTLSTCARGKDFQIQALPELGCPVTVISNASVGTSTQTRLQLNAARNQYLYYDREQQYPIADLKLTQYAFCPYWNQSNISPGKNGNYILQVINMSTTCNGTDPRIVEFDYLPEQSFISSNTLIRDILNQLPGYPRPSISYVYRLGYVRYPVWTHTCRVSTSYNLDQARRHLEMRELGAWVRVELVVGCTGAAVLGVLIRLLYLLRRVFELRSRREFNMVILTDKEITEQIPNLNIIKSVKREVVFFVIEQGLLIALLVVGSIGAYWLTSESAWIKDIFNNGCTEEHLEWIFRLYEGKVDNGIYITARIILFLVIVICLEAGHLAIRRKHGDLQPTDNTIEVQQVLSNEELIKNDLNADNDQNERHNLQDSSDIILRDKELKVYDMDNFMSNEMMGPAGGETGYNFYANNSIDQNNFQVVKKKKKKNVRRKNLFKEADAKNEEDKEQP